MTTFSPGTGQRIKLLDLGACYPAGTIPNVVTQGNWSASWPGQIKIWDIYYIAGYDLQDLAEKEAAVDAGGTGYLSHTTRQATTDSTLGGESFITGNGVIAALTATSRYISLYAKPQFSAVSWHTDDTSVLALNNVGGASSTACPVRSPVADFTATPTLTVIGGSIQFTDTSTNTPTSWAWTFGDGTTSTSQHPLKSGGYTAPGIYSITLTATNSNGSDSETKVAYIQILVDTGFEDPPPAGAILEIYASDPGSARWDVAKWDEDVWGGGGWQDVTPYGITVQILWGSDRPELGILNVPSPASWGIDYHDPDRILDPANPDGPYFGDLIPGLPIRLSHRSVVIRQGYATGISHSYADPQKGYMRGADVITVLANAQVPSDTELADTLYARAVDAIAAAGLSIPIQSPPGTDPPVSPWITGTREWSAWQWITDAAQEVLQIPYVNRLNVLTFRPWAAPLVRGRTIGDDELVDVTVIADYSGQFSVVQAREDVDTIVERALTPPPRYGARTFKRDEITIDPGGWAEAVLADRGLPSLRWEPGTIRPLTADSVEDIATIEATERISIALPAEDPALFVTGIVTGGEINVRGKYPDEAIWRFRLHLAQVADEPLIETGGEPTEYLERTGGGEYLYPTT